MGLSPQFSQEPVDDNAYTRRFDAAYTRFAAVYDAGVRILPIWMRWLEKVLPHIHGQNVLEISLGTGHLLTQYGMRHQCFAIDYNARMLRTARRNLEGAGVSVPLARADVHALPFPACAFDCVVNTMAFSGYPKGEHALREICRVLKTDGRLVLLDINYPANSSRIGSALVEMWKASGDLIRDMPALFRHCGFDYTDEEVGGFGSVHLYVARKRTD